MEQAIKIAIEFLIELPKGDTIVLWLNKKARLLGIRESVMHHLESVMLVALLTKEFSKHESMGSTYVTATTTNLLSTEVFSQMNRLEKTLQHLNLSGLANRLGITKEGVTRLIWWLEGVLATRSGSERYSQEMITLVGNALLEERILKQTITQLDLQPLLTKKESQLTKQHLIAYGYGIQKMDAHYVVSATGI